MNFSSKNIRIEKLYKKQKNLVNSIKRNEGISRFEGVSKGFFTPPPLLSSNPKLILIGLEPTMTASKFTKNIDWLSGFNNLTLHYAAWKSCGESFEYHFTDISKLSLSPKNASNIRDEVFERFLPPLIEEVNIMRENNDSCIVVSPSTVMHYINNRIPAPIYKILHWSKRVQYKHYENYLISNNLPLPNFSSNEFEDIYNTIYEFSDVLMSNLKFTPEEKKERQNYIFKGIDDLSYVKHKTYVFFYYVHLFSNLLRTNKKVN